MGMIAELIEDEDLRDEAYLSERPDISQEDSTGR
jgi:hypothetical protein